MPRSIRFAVVGAKGYSRTHLAYVQFLQQQGRGQLVASVMIDKQDHPELVAALSAENVRIFTDYQEMLDACRDQVDIVTFPVPIHYHAPMAVAALTAGYHVLVEKPVASTLEQVDEMIATRDRAQRACAVGFQQIYSAIFQQLKKYVIDSTLGQVKRMAIMALWPRSPTYYARNSWAGKLFCDDRPVYDSPFNNALAHQIMNMLYLASPAEDQAAYVKTLEAELYRAYDIESFDTGCLRATTDSGVEIIFATTHACQTTLHPTLILEAEKARVEWIYGQDAHVLYKSGDRETIVTGNHHHRMMENIADVVTGTQPKPLCTLEIGRTHVDCIQAVHRAATIRQVPKRLVSIDAEGQHSIAGIQETIERTFESGKLFSEQSAPFTRP